LTAIDEEMHMAVADCGNADAQPLSPSSSIMRARQMLREGFLKMQPALFCPSGWLERRFSLQIRSLAEFFDGLEEVPASLRARHIIRPTEARDDFK